jgi:hypothetical protein
VANQTTQGVIARAEDDTSFHVFQGRQSAWKSTTVLFGNFFLGLQGYGAWNFTGHGIPKGADILAATMTLTANTTSGPLSAPGQLQSSARGSDNRWDGPLDGSRVVTGWNSQAWADFDTRVRDTSPADVIDTHGAAASGLQWGQKWVDASIPSFAPNVRYQRIAQRLQAPSNFTLGSVVLKLGRLGTPTGNLFVDILANVPATNQPDDSTVLATSDAVLASSIAAVAGDVTFTFSGGDQIALTSGTVFHAVLRNEYAPSSTDFVFWNWSSQFFGGPYTLGEGWIYGDGVGCDDNNFPGNADVSVFRSGPRDTNLDVPWTIPAFVAGLTYTTPDISGIVQDQVSSPLYADGGAIGVDLITLAAPNNRRVRAFSHPLGGSAVLDVTWRPRQNRARLF